MTSEALGSRMVVDAASRPLRLVALVARRFTSPVLCGTGEELGFAPHPRSGGGGPPAASGWRRGRNAMRTAPRR